MHTNFKSINGQQLLQKCSDYTVVMIYNSLYGDKEVCKSLEEFLFEMKEWCKQTGEWTDREDENQSRSIQTP